MTTVNRAAVLRTCSGVGALLLFAVSCTPAHTTSDRHTVVNRESRPSGPALVPVAAVWRKISTGSACWPSWESRPSEAWLPGAATVTRAEIAARDALERALPARVPEWSPDDYRTQFIGVVIGGDSVVVGVGIHRQLLSPMSLGLPEAKFDENAFLHNEVVLVCDAGAMQFILVFDSAGVVIRQLRFFDSQNGAGDFSLPLRRN